MNLSSPFVLLIATSIILAVVNLIRPSWPALGVAVLLTNVAVLIGK